MDVRGALKGQYHAALRNAGEVRWVRGERIQPDR